MDFFRVDGKVAAITGGAGGIGPNSRAVAQYKHPWARLLHAASVSYF